MSYRQERVTLSCPECPGLYGELSMNLDGVSEDQANHGYLGGHILPPAGIQNRTPTGVVESGRIWGTLEHVATAKGLCPRCSAPVDESVDICEDHESSERVCDHCGNRHMVQRQSECRNCLYTQNGPFAYRLPAHPDFLAFLTTRGVDPHSPTPDLIQTFQECEEEILSIDPFEARFTFTLDDDSITLTVDDVFSVVDVSKDVASMDGF